MDSVIENSMVIAGISTRIDDPTNAAQQIETLWHKFWQENISSKVINKFNGTIYTVYHNYQGDFTKPYTTTIGYRINKIEDAPALLSIVVIPAQHYKVFTAHGRLPESIVNIWKKIWQANLHRTYTFDLEIYDERAQNPQDAIVDIYIAVTE